LIHAAVLGSPISHSLSPLLHIVAYKHLGIEGEYEAIEVKSGDLATFLSTTTKDALSLTMPLKEEALGVAHDVSQIAKKISGGNTLVRSGTGWNLTSTDVEGFKYALLGYGISKVENCLIIGAGATARAAVAAVSELAENIIVLNRNPERVAQMNTAAARKVTCLPWETDSHINIADLVINTTPAYVADQFESALKSPQGVLFEVLYHPWPTVLAQCWINSGAKVIDGLDLLIHQAISQVEIFAQLSVNRSEMYGLMRTAALDHLG
jgi:shikimate dehydrogenase